MIIFKSILTTFDVSIIFEAPWAVENSLEAKKHLCRHFEISEILHLNDISYLQ